MEYTKRVIENAMDIKFQHGISYDWEFYQQELKNNSLSYYDDSKVSRIAHVFWKEFDGRITHAIVERNSTTGGEATMGTGKSTDIQFLFIKVGRFASFQEAIHPMYFSHGNGGYHHSVTGLGVRMFSAMEYQNRLLCNLADKAFAAKLLFKPTTTESSQKFTLARFGDYAVMPPGFEWQQTGVAGLMNDGMAMNAEITSIVGDNLLSFRGQQMKDTGNPVTAEQVSYDANMQSSLSKTQFNRYYEQLDMLYAECYRRMSNLNSTDSRAKKFQERCIRKGVPVEALGRIRSVQASRVVGQGSAFMRKQAVNNLLPIAGSLPEEGRNNLISDKIAAEAGQSAVNRYNPAKLQTKLPSDQQAEAVQWIGLMKTGIAPVITSSQNPAVFATAFINAAMQSLQSIQKGGDPHQVIAFLSLCGPAILAQLKRYANDPTRQGLFKQQMEQWKQISQAADELTKHLQDQANQQQQAQQNTQAAMTEEQLAAQKTQHDIQLKNVKTAAALKQSQEKHNLKMRQGIQNLALQDAKTAADIHRQNIVAKSNEKSAE